MLKEWNVYDFLVSVLPGNNTHVSNNNTYLLEVQEPLYLHTRLVFLSVW